MRAPPGCSLRAARPADAAALSELVDDAYGHYVERIGGLPGPMTLDYAEVIRTQKVTVVERGGEIVGLLALAHTEDGFTIENVAVRPEDRGEGLGRALLELAEQEARCAGCDSIHLYTHEKMIENLELYAKIGYLEYDRRPRDGFSLVFMRKRLAGAGSLVTRETTPEEEMATPTLSRQMLEIHPWAGEVDLDALADCIAACYECAQTCMGCADACLSEVEIDPLRKCIRINLDCADICDVTGRVLTRQTEYDAPTTKAQLAACREACATCAEECERHAENHEHCRICAEACRHCEQACANLLESAMK